MKRFFLSLIGFLLFLAVVLAAAFVFLPLPGTVPVLMYHFVGTEAQAAESKNYVSRTSFANHLDFLRRFGYRVLTLEEYYGIKTGKRRPRGREVLITFDDGNYSFEKEAFPILEFFDFPAAVFLVSESMKHETNGSMTAETVKKLLATGRIAVGAHSKTHPLLTRIDDQELKDELAGSKEDLEKMLEVPIRDLAYPNGDVDQRVREASRQAGYRLAFTTSYKNLGNLDEGLHSLTRVKISRSADNPVVFWVKVSGIYDLAKSLRHQIKRVSAIS